VRRRPRHALIAAVALGALTAPGAAAHVTVQPGASRPAELQRYRVIVPNERTRGATIGVDLQVPAGVDFALVEAAPPWRARVVRRAGRIAELRWRGGAVAPGGYAELHFIARNPVRIGTLPWKALQRYQGGDVVRWIGAPSSERPAARTRLSEDAVPVDVVSTHGEAVPSAGTPARAATAPQAADTDGRDTLTLAIAIAAAALAAAALVLQLARRRGRAPT
jgi:uncharacterized protein YcnI